MQSQDSAGVFSSGCARSANRSNLRSRITRNRQRTLVSIVSAVALVDCTVSASHAASFTWVSGTSSSWNVASNWSGSSGFPNDTVASPDNDVLINPVVTSNTTFTPVVNVPITIDLLTIQMAGALLTIAPTQTLTLNGSTLTNNGTLAIDTGGAQATSSDLYFSATTEIAGTGAIMLDNNNANAKITAAPAAVVTNDATHTIEGLGEIDAALTNNGTINANVSGGTLTLQTNPMTNANLLEATASGSTLEVSGITVTQQTDGDLLGTNGGVVNMDNAIIVGGTVSGAVDVDSATFSGVTVAPNATVAVSPGDTLTIAGATLTNKGTIQVDYQSGLADLYFSSNTLLTGSGKVSLNSYSSNALLTAATGVTVTNDIQQTIDGVGEIDAALVNNGIVDGDYSAHPLILQDNPMTNNLTFEATGAGILQINGIAVTQGASGLISTSGSGTVKITGAASITGGTIGGSVTVNGGTSPNLTFSGVTIAAKANVVVTSTSMLATTLNITGATFTDNGNIQVDNGSYNSDLNFTGTTLLTGTGTVTLDDNASNARLTDAAGTLTVDVAQTIQGEGEIDTPLVNNGSITATYSNASVHTLTLKSPITGTGMLGAGANATLALGTGTGLTTQAGVSIASTGHLDIANNRLMIDYGATDPLTTLDGYLKTGFATGPWSGPGIDSSTASVNTKYAVGCVDAASGIDPALSSGQILLQYTLFGDVNLDGAVNGTDFAILAKNFGKTISGGWEVGDLNYDGAVTGADFALLAVNFGKTATGGALALPASDWAALDSFAAANGLLADVPEPGSALLVVPAAMMLLPRRRRAQV